MMYENNTGEHFDSKKKEQIVVIAFCNINPCIL